MSPGKTKVAMTQEDRLRSAYRTEMRQLVTQRFPYSLGLFLFYNDIACLLEQHFLPERGVDPISVSLLYPVIGAAAFLILKRAPRATMAVISVTQNLFIAIICIYYTQYRGDATLLAASLLLNMAGFAVLVPCSLGQYLLACAWVAVGYPWALGFIPIPSIVFSARAATSSGVMLVGAVSTIPTIYNFFVLFAGACTLSLGVYLLDYHRFTAYCQTLRAQQADAAKSEFLATVSHELRTPLNIIIGYSSILLEEFTDKTFPQLRPVQRIHAQSLELLHLIQNMLDLHRLEAGDIALAVEEFQLTDLMDSLHSSLPSNWTKPGVELLWRLPPTQIVLRSDRRKLEVVMRNLIHNALKFTERGNVTVSAGLQYAQSLSFHVKDTGPGIALEDHNRIFEMFQQSGGNGNGRGGGVGMGLYIVKRFTEALGGSVQIESQLGAGSCFTILLPLSLSA